MWTGVGEGVCVLWTSWIDGPIVIDHRPTKFRPTSGVTGWSANSCLSCFEFSHACSATFNNSLYFGRRWTGYLLNTPTKPAILVWKLGVSWVLVWKLRVSWVVQIQPTKEYNTGLRLSSTGIIIQLHTSLFMKNYHFWRVFSSRTLHGRRRHQFVGAAADFWWSAHRRR